MTKESLPAPVVRASKGGERVRIQNADQVVHKNKGYRMELWGGKESSHMECITRIPVERWFIQGPAFERKGGGGRR